MNKMPVLFVGHGSPMIALENNDLTNNFKKVGQEIIEKYQKPKGILVISAHWFTPGFFTNDEENPRQIYDMYGFPDELYQVDYKVKGSYELANKLTQLTNNKVVMNNEWGIDHGTWTVLVHMFPDGDIPVVQLSVNYKAEIDEIYELGRELSQLRDQGYLIIGSGNIVHNLGLVEWSNEGGSEISYKFDNNIKEAILRRDDKKVLDYKSIEGASYAVPTLDHFLPLIYILGASDEVPKVFNNVSTLGSISMTSYAFGL